MSTSIRSRREAQVVKFRPRVLLFEETPGEFNEIKIIFEEMKWIVSRVESIEECIQFFLSSSAHILLSKMNNKTAWMKLCEDLKYTGKLKEISFCCINSDRETYEFFKESDLNSLFYNGSSHTFSDLLKGIRNTRPELVRIAIADDLFVIRSQLKMAILLMRHSLVAEASNGVEATSSCTELRPDILTLDINMPMKNGIQTLIDVRKASPHTRIVMISGQGTESNVIEAAKNGIQHFISKPFTRELLISTIKEACFDVSYLSSLRL